MRVKFALPEEVRSIYEYTLAQLCKRHLLIQIDYVITDEDLSIGVGSGYDILISSEFVKKLAKGDLTWRNFFDTEPIIRCENGSPDYVSTILYMINYLQEYNSDTFDAFQRFKYSASYQSEFNCSTENLVIQYFYLLISRSKKLSSFPKVDYPSRLFVSHDIDILHHSIWPDLKTSVRKLKIAQILNLLFFEALRDRDGEIFHRMQEINRLQDIIPTYFWLTTSKKTRVSGDWIENANYDIEKPRIKNLIQGLARDSIEIGLHKSLEPSSYIEERKHLGQSIICNRNHYLAGTLEATWTGCDAAQIKIDHSAGFAEQMGLRNSYGLPWRAYSLKENTHRKVLSVPLHIMEVHFMKADKKADQALVMIQDFISKHRTNCIISILWHNNYFSQIKFPNWIHCYQEILTYSRELGIKPITNVEILNDFP